MPPISVCYGFSQHFDVPAHDAYRWCTDYEPNDLALMGDDGKRRVQQISEDTIMLTDTIRVKNGLRVTKQKLVRFYRDRLTWTSTHVAGPNKYSQFLYEIVSDGKNGSRLDFTGLHLEYNDEKEATRSSISSLANKLRKEDSSAWKLLARAMEKDLKR